MKRHFYFRLPGDFYPGDIYAESVEEARKELRELLGVKRLPKGTDVWRSDYAGSWDVEFAFLRMS
jgi:hypothetical protein